MLRLLRTPIVFLLFILLLGGCTSVDQSATTPPATTVPPTTSPASPATVPAEAQTEVPNEIPNLMNPAFMGMYEEGESMVFADDAIPLASVSAPVPAMFFGLLPEASGKQTKVNDKAVIDYSNANDGYVMIKYVSKRPMPPTRVKIVGPSGAEYDYFIRADGEYEVFPLSDGNGRYAIAVAESPDNGKSYAMANSVAVEVKLNDEFAPFLRPNQYINFNANSKVVETAYGLIKGIDDTLKKVESIYNFVIKGFKYDDDKADQVIKGVLTKYVPDVDEILESKKGICFDYAAVTTAMLRSQGIPSRMIHGYASTPQGSVYHAWIDVWSEKDGWINAIIQFDGKDWKLMDPTFASTGGGDKAVANIVGDGKNYKAKFLY
ncbi:MAG: lasso peptide biosynthesis protein [Symbiobacteriaceae bacterium]|nr:lasso peptide biosynthesis protein [Symbiobacteriaceae bacterium]